MRPITNIQLDHKMNQKNFKSIHNTHYSPQIYKGINFLCHSFHSFHVSCRYFIQLIFQFVLDKHKTTTFPTKISNFPFENWIWIAFPNWVWKKVEFTRPKNLKSTQWNQIVYEFISGPAEKLVIVVL